MQRYLKIIIKKYKFKYIYVHEIQIIFHVAVGTCSGSTNDPAFGTLELSAGTSPNVGTVYEVQCNDGYEQTAGEPVIVCQLDLSWNDAPANVVCSRKFFFLYEKRRLRPRLHKTKARQ